jgi:hypothetical protein
MTTNEIITELVSYDGWDIAQEKHTQLFNNYLTDLNILHRVAVKVYNEMQSKITDSDKGIDWDASSHCNTILYALLDSPINGEYITLATATAEAIIYLKSYKP